MVSLVPHAGTAVQRCSSATSTCQVLVGTCLVEAQKSIPGGQREKGNGFTPIQNTFISGPKYRIHLLAQTCLLFILQLILAHGIRGAERREGILSRKEDIENEA